MKKGLMFLGICICILAGCQDEVIDLKVDKVNVSEKTDEWEIKADFSSFSSDDKEINDACTVMNIAVRDQIEYWSKNIRKEAGEFYDSYVTDTTGMPAWVYQLYVKDTVFQATNNYISTRILSYTYTGGAHGLTSFTAFNYDVRQRKFLNTGDILDTTKVELIDKVLKDNFKNPDSCFWDVPTLKTATAVNFTKESIIFIYEQYLLGPYSCGYYEATIPKKEIQKAVKL